MALAFQSPVCTRRRHNVTIIARRKLILKKAGKLLLSDQITKGQEILTLSADVTNLRDINDAIEMSVKKLGTPHRLFVSAGRVSPGYFQDIPLSDFRSDMDVNFLVPYMLFGQFCLQW